MKNVLLILGTFLFILCTKTFGFSISISDTPEKYSNDQNFEQIETVDDKLIGYKFSKLPASYFEVDVSDQDIAGGYVLFKKNKLCNAFLIMNSKKGFYTILDRFEKVMSIHGINKADASIEKGYGYIFVMNNNENTTSFSSDKYMSPSIFIVYEPFKDNFNVVFSSGKDCLED